MQELKGRCKTCFWNVNLPRCRPEKMITHSGTCQDWRLRKMTEAQKAKEATVMKAAHASDVARKVEEKKKTKRGKK
jgi:hypothetical protein